MKSVIGKTFFKETRLPVAWMVCACALSLVLLNSLAYADLLPETKARIAQLNDALVAEVLDADWAKKSETIIRDVLDKPQLKLSALKAECRKTICRVEFEAASVREDVAEKIQLAILEAHRVAGLNQIHMSRDKNHYFCFFSRDDTSLPARTAQIK